MPEGTYKTIGQEKGVRQLVDFFYNIFDSTKDQLSRFLMAWMGDDRHTITKKCLFIIFSMLTLLLCYNISRKN